MNRIREIIEERNLTFAQVAASAGVATKTVYNAANGMKSNRSTRKLIARALRKPESYVFPSAAAMNHCSNIQEAV